MICNNCGEFLTIVQDRVYPCKCYKLEYERGFNEGYSSGIEAGQEKDYDESFGAFVTAQYFRQQKC